MGLETTLRAVCLAAIVLVGSRASAAEPAELLRQIRTTVIDVDAAVSLRNLQVEMGPGLLDIERGILIPAHTSSGRPIELVFIGQARFLLDPPNEIEAGQLELFTGDRQLDAPIEEAVLVLTNSETVDRLLKRPAPRELRPQLIMRAEELHREWLDRTERRKSGIDAAVFKALVGDEAYRDYFAIWCRSFELGDFVYQLDPEDEEPITLASFIPVELTPWERREVRRNIRVQQRKGRWLGVRLEDLGAWDIWLSTDWRPDDGPALPGNVGFETEHYELDVTLKRDRLRVEGRARLHLTANASGRRTVPIELFSDLEVTEVKDEQGRELFFFRSGDEIVVLLNEASTAGETQTLDVVYSGRVLQWVGSKTFDLLNTSMWYPHCGNLDRATYDVTLRWPKTYEMLAAGKRIEGGQDGRYRWERRRLDIPSIAFSFVLGNYDIERTRVGDVALKMAFNRGTRATPEARAAALETAAASLEFFQDTFGEYPLDELTLVTVPRAYSQSYLGFITLAESMMTRSAGRADWQRDMTIAHEVAHQWWGNLVGWWSYRDQWLSEGMANYSALLFDGELRGDGFSLLGVMSAGWRESLSQTTMEGRTVESLGPVVLGSRLNSSRAYNAYRPIVYRKGAVVLSMLGRAVGPDRFHGMLGALSEAASGTVLTTEAFVQSIEKMSGFDLQGFARQFIYGTGIPQVHYDYDLSYTQTDGWSVQGEARRLRLPGYRLRVVRSDEGLWDVLRVPRPYPDNGSTTLMVPYRVTLGETDPDDSGPLARRREGQLFLEGEHARFVIDTGHEPVDLKLDPRGEVLARFFSTEENPQRVLRYRAENLVALGRLDDAETAYRAALEAPGESSGSIDPLHPAAAMTRRDDARLHLSLARLYADQKRLEESALELDRVDELVEAVDPMRFRMERDAIRSRLELARGEHRPALRRLKKTLKLAASKRESWRHVLWKIQLNRERVAVSEAYALMAIAAFEEDSAEEFDWALDEARKRGVDVAALRRAARAADQ